MGASAKDFIKLIAFWFALPAASIRLISPLCDCAMLDSLSKSCLSSSMKFWGPAANLSGVFFNPCIVNIAIVTNCSIFGVRQLIYWV